MSRETQEKKSFILSLKEEGRVNESFLNLVSDLTIEELIVIKLEQICRDACMLFVRTCCSTKADMASVLGVPYEYFVDLYKKYYKEY